MQRSTLNPSLVPTSDTKPKQHRLRVIVGRVLLRLALVALTLVTCGAAYQAIASARDRARYPAPGALIDVGGYRLHLFCTGKGSPTVVLDAGAGDNLLAWSRVQPELARLTRVCSYDRAGLGWSDAGLHPRTSEQMVYELHTLLHAARTPEPYLLVGHSLGGLNAQLYASLYPAEVVGMVLVDSAHEDQNTRLTPPSPALFTLVKLLAPIGVIRLLSHGQPPDSRFPPEAGIANQVLGLTTRAAWASSDEYLAFDASLAHLKAARKPLGAIPLVVLTRGKGARTADEVAQETIWRTLQDDLAARSPTSLHLIAEQSGHVIPLDQPAAVVEAITRALRAVRTGTQPQ